MLVSMTLKVAAAVRTVTFNGKLYALERDITLAGDHGYMRCVEANVSYYSTRDGRPFGPVRRAGANAKPGSVAAAVWAAASAGIDLE